MILAILDYLTFFIYKIEYLYSSDVQLQALPTRIKNSELMQNCVWALFRVK